MPQKVMRMSVFASLMQRYDFFRNYASKIQNIFRMERKKLTFPLSHFPTSDIYILKNLKQEFLHYIYNIYIIYIM